MSPLRLCSLAFKSFRSRRASVLLSVAAILISVLLFTGVQYLRGQVQQWFVQTISSTDLVVGARSGPVNLLLYSVFRIGNATNNIEWDSYRMIAEHPQVAWAVPLSLGDSHRGYRVIGTTADYFEHYRYGERQPLRFSAGAPFQAVRDVVLGAEVARQLEYGLGAELEIAHGLVDTRFARHRGQAFRVVGILAPTGTPVDRGIHISLEGLEAVHANWGSAPRLAAPQQHADHDHGEHEHAVTAVLVGMKSKPMTFALQRQLNEYRGEPLLAILPGIALAELWQVLGVVESLLLVISGFVVAAGLTGLLITLLSSLNERRREMAVLRAVGAGPRHIVFLLLFEAFWMSLLACAGAVVVLYGLIWALAPLLLEKSGIAITLQPLGRTEWLQLAAVVVAATLLALVPALVACRRALTDGLSVRV
jgi:putative ABC transport system permease protein